MSFIQNADDTSLDSWSENLADVFFNLRHDGRNIEWFTKMACKLTLTSFILDCLLPRLQNSRFSNYVVERLTCLKLRQLNAHPRIYKHLNINSRMAIYSSFIMSSFSHCPLVWHIRGQVNNHKHEKIQERALRILFAHYNSSYMELLEKAGTTTLLLERFRLIALTVFTSLHGFNPPCLNYMFTPKYVSYQMRDSSLLEQSCCRTTYSISYIGAKLWNDLPNDCKEITCLMDSKMILQTWAGPDLNDLHGPYLIPSTNQKFYLFDISSHASIPLITCPLHYRLVLISLCVSVTVVNS